MWGGGGGGSGMRNNGRNITKFDIHKSKKLKKSQQKKHEENYTNTHHNQIG